MSSFSSAMGGVKFGLKEYRHVVDKNQKRLESIGKELDAIKRDLELLRPGRLSLSLYLTPSDQEVYQFNQRIDAFNAKVTKFNRHVEIFNAQLEDYNAEVARWETLSVGLSNFIYAIKEHWQYPIEIPEMSRLSIRLPPSASVAVPPTTYIWPSLSQIDERLKFDDSYNHVPKPDRQSIKKFERISEQNFVVNSFKLWW